jgi:hypothetical protein
MNRTIAPFLSRLLQEFKVPRLPHGRRQAVNYDTFFFAAPETGHEQDLTFDSRLP